MKHTGNTIATLLGFLLLFGICQPILAQGETDERALLKVPGSLSFRQDSLFLLNLRFRMQNRAGFNTISGENLRIGQYDFRVRRLRLRLDGFLMHPRFQYYIQLSFSRADLDLEAGEVAQPIRDAVLYYHLSKRFYVGFGQAKLPGNRQRVLSSGSLQFADRSIANAAFTLDRDFGMFAYWEQPLWAQAMLYAKGAVSSGDGRNAPANNDGLAYTGRVELLPFGTFRNSGDYSEGDIEYEPRPRLSIAAGYSYNSRASRTGGQLGQDLFELRDMGTFIADLMTKYKGWALMAEYFYRHSPNPFTRNLAGDIRYILTGNGMNVQASRMLTPKTEIAARYAFVQPSAQMQGLEARLDEALLGLSRYINKHRIKVQANVGYRWQQEGGASGRGGNRWTGLFQVEYGL